MGGLLARGRVLLRALSEKSIVIMKKSIHCVWFKRDLRIHDHSPLTNAAKSGYVLPVYIVEPEVVHAADFDALHWQFIRESLLDLQRSLSDLGASLQVLQGSAVEVFESLHDRYGFSSLWAHEETGNAITYRRDQAIKKWVASRNISFVEALIPIYRS